MWRYHWKKYGGRRAGKILLDSAASIEKWRGVLVLWGGTFGVLLFFGTPLGDAVMSTWYLLPWWTVPVFLSASLVALFVRGLIKANYEEFQKLEKERNDLREEAQQQIAPPNEDLRQRSCELSAELFAFYERWWEGKDRALQPGEAVASVYYEVGGDSERSLEAARHDSWLMKEYRKQFGSKVMRLSDELAQQRCITPETRNKFENPEKPQDIEYIAQRLDALCNSPDFDPQEWNN